MTTEKFFTFDLQRFDGEATVSASSGRVSLSSDYAFSGSEADDANSAVDVVTYDSSSATVRSISSAAWVKGGTIVDSAVLNSIGTISSFGEDGRIELTASGNVLRVAGLTGDTLDIALTGGQIRNQTINGVALNFSSEEVVRIYGGSDSSDLSAVTVSSASASLNSIDTNQTWLISNGSNLTFKGTQYTGESEDDITITAASNNGTLNAGLADGGAISVASVSSGVADTLGINGTVIAGAIATASKITREGEDLTLRAGSAGNISVNGGYAAVAERANATISLVDDEAAITAVTSLKSGGNWVVTANEVTLGAQDWAFSDSPSTITADSLGTSAATVQFAGNATLESSKNLNTSINANKAATWSLNGSSDSSVIFGDSGSVTLSSSSLTAGLSGTNNQTLTGAADDAVVLANGGIATISDNNIVAVNSIAAGQNWTVGGTEASLGSGNSLQTWAFENAGATLTASNSNGAAVSKVSGLTGNATLTYGASVTPASLTVGSTTWTSIKNDSDGIVIFDSVGSATVSSNGYDEAEMLQVASSAEASLKLTSTSEEGYASLNGVYVEYTGDSNGIDVVLEARGTNAGVSAINDLATGAELVVNGDNNFSINGAYTFSNSGSSGAELKIESSQLVVENLGTGDNISVTGGEVAYTFDTVASAKVSLEGVAVTLQAASDTSNITITGSESDAVSAVSLKAGDSITTSGDEVFDLYYDASDVTSSSKYVLSANDVKVSVYGSNFTGDSATVNVDNSGSTPYVTINGIGNSATLSVTGGVYNIGKSAQVTVNEATGYITLDSSGNATAEDESAAESRRQRESSVNSALENSSSTSVTAFQFYYNMDNTPPTAVASSTVAGYDNSSDTTPVTASVSGGINIYGNTKFSDKSNLHAITLQSAVADDINIAEAEGSSIWTSYIDVTGSARNTLVAVGTGSTSSAINHTILGSNNGGILMFGENAKGNNYAQAGSLGTYLENLGGQATLLGGAGEDSIVAGAGDYVYGGAGKDYFFDNNGGSNSGGYFIRDYSISEGDVIVATKFSDINNNLTAAELINEIDVADSVIAIAGGSAMTVGTSSGTGFDVVFADAAMQNTYNFAWAASGGGTVDASSFTDKGAIILASQNGGMGDSILGTGDDDTIFAGGNDTVNPGDGNDDIYLAEVSAGDEEAGAMVVLSSNGSGYHMVHGFSFGFDNEDGGNSILNADPSSLTFKISASTLVAYSGTNTIAFGGTETVSGSQFDLLVGDADSPEKVTVLKSGGNITVNSADDVADRYYGITNNTTLTFAEGITDSLNINLSEGTFSNITRIAVNNDNISSIIGGVGSNAKKDIVSLGGAADIDAHNYVSLGGGDDVIYSGGTSTTTAGNYFYVGLNSDGDDTIHNFGFYQGVETDPDADAADVLVMYGWNADSTIVGNANDSLISIALSEDNTVNIAGEIDPNNMLRYRLNGDNSTYVAKIGATSGQTNTFTYDKEVGFYRGNGNRNVDTLQVDNSDRAANAEVWLDGEHGTYYGGIGVIDASAAQNTQVTLVGNEISNTIIGAGEGSYSTLWGGTHGENELIGGDGDDLFFFVRSDNNDTISNYDVEHDRVHLFDITYEDLDSLIMNDESITIGLKSSVGGGQLAVEHDGNGAKFDLSNGDGTYTSWTAAKDDDGNWSWQEK